MSNQIKKLLSKGDIVYCARTGKPMRVTKVSKFGFYTEKKYFFLMMSEKNIISHRKAMKIA